MRIELILVFALNSCRIATLLNVSPIYSTHWGQGHTKFLMLRSSISRWAFLECIIKTARLPWYFAHDFFVQLIERRRKNIRIIIRFEKLRRKRSQIIEIYIKWKQCTSFSISILIHDINSHGFKLVFSEADKNMKV